MRSPVQIWVAAPEALKNRGLTVVRNYLSCGWGRGRCDRKGHAVFLRPRVDSAIMGSASTGISTSSTKLKMISAFCLRLPSDLSGACDDLLDVLVDDCLRQLCDIHILFRQRNESIQIVAHCLPLLDPFFRRFNFEL